jgi:hypothetical protein
VRSREEARGGSDFIDRRKNYGIVIVHCADAATTLGSSSAIKRSPSFACLIETTGPVVAYSNERL